MISTCAAGLQGAADFGTIVLDIISQHSVDLERCKIVVPLNFLCLSMNGCHMSQNSEANFAKDM